MAHCFKRRLAVFGIALAAVSVTANAQQVGDKTVKFILPNAMPKTAKRRLKQ